MIMTRVARVPTRMELARAALAIIFCSAAACDRVDQAVLAALSMSDTADEPPEKIVPPHTIESRFQVS
jgi:hypothetical protein